MRTLSCTVQMARSPFISHANVNHVQNGHGCHSLDQRTQPRKDGSILQFTGSSVVRLYNRDRSHNRQTCYCAIKVGDHLLPLSFVQRVSIFVISDQLEKFSVVEGLLGL